MKTTARYNIDNFPPDILAGIGEIIARWGYLQMQLGVIIRVALQLRKDAGRLVTIGAGASIGNLCRMLQALAHSDHWIPDEDVRRQIKSLARDVQKKSKDRNDYAHGVFGDGGAPSVFVRHLMKDPDHLVQPEQEPITAVSLQAISTDARNLWIRAQYITHKLKGKI